MGLFVTRVMVRPTYELEPGSACMTSFARHGLKYRWVHTLLGWAKPCKVNLKILDARGIMGVRTLTVKQKLTQNKRKLNNKKACFAESWLHS